LRFVHSPDAEKLSTLARALEPGNLMRLYRGGLALASLAAIVDVFGR
jgi:hypothetical protein